MRKIAFVLLLVLVFSGCKHREVSGYVVGKEYVPSRVYSYYDVVFKRPMIRTAPEAYVIWLADSCGVDTLHVDKHIFTKLKHGEFIDSRQWQRSE
jgi:hypothetical protein